MKLEPRTIQILKNFSGINPSIVFRKGHRQMTMHPMKKAFVRAVIEEDMPVDFAIFDLSKFIGTLSLFKEPDLEVGKKYLIISEKGQRVNFTFGEPDLIVSPKPDTKIELAGKDVEFKLIDSALNQLNKAAGILGLPHIVISGDGETVEVGVGKCDDPSSNKFKLAVGRSKNKFQFVMDVEHFRVLPGDYNVTISAEDGIIYFQEKDVEYWMTTEHNHNRFE